MSQREHHRASLGIRERERDRLRADYCRLSWHVTRAQETLLSARVAQGQLQLDAPRGAFLQRLPRSRRTNNTLIHNDAAIASKWWFKRLQIVLSQWSMVYKLSRPSKQSPCQRTYCNHWLWHDCNWLKMNVVKDCQTRVFGRDLLRPVRTMKVRFTVTATRGGGDAKAPQGVQLGEFLLWRAGPTPRFTFEVG